MNATCSLLACLGFASALAAQLPDWSALPCTPTRVFNEAHIAVVQEAAAVHAFSTYTRVWAHLPTSSATASFQGFDDHVLVVDGSSITAYASRFGVFVPLAPTAPTQSIPSLPASSYLSVVIDGTRVHAFSPFLGTWTTLVCQGAPGVAVSKMVAVVRDGTSAYGYSPLFGTFVPLAAALQTTPSLDARCYCGYATDGQTHHGFSAEHNTWATIPAAGTAVLQAGLARSGYLLFLDGAEVDFYSGITGNVTHLSCVQPPTVTQGEQVCVLQDAVLTQLFSAVTDSTYAIGFATPPTVRTGNYFALLQDGQDVHTFSAVTGTFAPVLQGSWSIQPSINCALATDPSGATKAYSPLRNLWVDGPTAPGAMPTVTQGSVALLDGAQGRLHGFAVRSATWSSIAATGVDSTYTFGSNFCARAGNDLFVFNERFGRWSHDQTATPGVVRLHQQTVLAQAGTELLAYSHWNDRWTRTQASSAPVLANASDDSGLVQDGQGVHVFSASCQTSSLSLYPEWWRFQARGTECAFYMAGEPGTLAVLVAHFATASIQVPGIGGVLGVQPTNATVLFGVLPAQGCWRIPFTIPANAALTGMTVYTQGLFTPASGYYFGGVYPTTII